MSYARMSGEFSDIYLFSTVWDMEYGPAIVWECMSCKLQASKTVKVTDDVKSFWIKRAEDKLNYKPPDTYTYIPSSLMFNIKAVYRHLRHHTMRGHKVPITAVQRIVAEYYGVPIRRMLELWPRESWEFGPCHNCGRISEYLFKDMPDNSAQIRCEFCNVILPEM